MPVWLFPLWINSHLGKCLQREGPFKKMLERWPDKRYFLVRTRRTDWFCRCQLTLWRRKVPSRLDEYCGTQLCKMLQYQILFAPTLYEWKRSTKCNKEAACVRACEAVRRSALTPSLQVCTCACAVPSFAGMLNSCLLSRCEAELEPWPMTFHMLVLLAVLGVSPKQARGRKSGIYFAHILQPTVRSYGSVPPSCNTFLL